MIDREALRRAIVVGVVSCTIMVAANVGIAVVLESWFPIVCLVVGLGMWGWLLRLVHRVHRAEKVAEVMWREAKITRAEAQLRRSG